RDPLVTGVQTCALPICPLPIREPPGGLDHQVHAKVFPGQFLRVFLGENLDRLAVHDEVVIVSFDGCFQGPVNRVILQEIGQRLGVREVIDREKIQLGIAQRRPQHVAPDPPEPVDSDTYGHVSASSLPKTKMPAEQRPAHITASYTGLYRMSSNWGMPGWGFSREHISRPLRCVPSSLFPSGEVVAGGVRRPEATSPESDPSFTLAVA